MNDIRMSDCFSIVEEIITVKMFPYFDYKVNGTVRNLCYYLVDIIYPKRSLFINTIADVIIKKVKVFSRAQKVCRKDVERTSGLLVARWHILAKLCNYHNIEKCMKVMSFTLLCTTWS